MENCLRTRPNHHITIRPTLHGVDEMSAFEKWFTLNFKENIEVGADYIVHCCAHGPSDSVVWDYLDKTGDRQYTRETFIKAAKIIMGVE